jgi:hypothetical protein
LIVVAFAFLPCESCRYETAYSQPRKPLWAVLVAAVITFFITVNSPPSPRALVHYAALAIIVFALSALISPASMTARKWITGLTGPVVLVVWWSYSLVDCYDDRWTSENGTRFVDSRRRSGALYERYALFPDNGFAHGPMTETGKLHGQWTYSTLGTIGLKTRWYWYGEEITEGEWHLRNK